MSFISRDLLIGAITLAFAVGGGVTSVLAIRRTNKYHHSIVRSQNIEASLNKQPNEDHHEKFKQLAEQVEQLSENNKLLEEKITDKEGENSRLREELGALQQTLKNMEHNLETIKGKLHKTKAENEDLQRKLVLAQQETSLEKRKRKKNNCPS